MTNIASKENHSDGAVLDFHNRELKKQDCYFVAVLLFDSQSYFHAHFYNRTIISQMCRRKLRSCVSRMGCSIWRI